MNPRKKGVLLINLGTPDSPETPDVRRYLRQFLSDPRVIDIHPLGRWLLLNLVILPFRPGKSAEAYRTIWTREGSPLLFHTRDLTRKVATLLSDRYVVDFAMRYGNPSIPSRLQALADAGCGEILLFPLFPQYASSSTGSALECAVESVRNRWNFPALKTVPAFYDDPGFVSAFAECGKQSLLQFAPDCVVFSYHGLPERHILKSECQKGFCLAPGDACCAAMVPANRFCYRAQCFETTRLLAKSLGLTPERYVITFQSRLGRSPWIRPYTDEEIVTLARTGKKRALVFCPAFVADCLETLEEIEGRAREDFLKHGGTDLRLVPSLNSNDAWVRAVVALVEKNL